MKSKHLIFGILLFFLSLTGAQAQDIAAYFASMPGNLIPELEINRRKDLIDLYRDNQTAVVKNSFRDDVFLEQLTDDYLKLRSDSSSHLEMLLLTMINDSKIILAIETRCAPVCDSRVHFYSTDWKPLDSRHIFTPVDASWFFKEDADESDPDFSIARSYTDIELMEFRINPEDRSLIQLYNTPKYLNKADYEKIKPFLREEPKIYHWQQTQFK